MYSIERSNSPGHAGKLGLFLYLLHGSQGELCYHCLLTGYFLNLFLAELAQSRWNIQANNSKKQEARWPDRRSDVLCQKGFLKYCRCQGLEGTAHRSLKDSVDEKLSLLHSQA